MFTMIYEDDSDDIKEKIEMTLPHGEEFGLTTLFLNFVAMTEKIGYSDKSWNNVIRDAFKYCIVHEDAPDNYTVFQWADDCRYPE